MIAKAKAKVERALAEARYNELRSLDPAAANVAAKMSDALRILKKVAAATTLDGFIEFIDTGDGPPLKLTSAEMQMLSGGYDFTADMGGNDAETAADDVSDFATAAIAVQIAGTN